MNVENFKNNSKICQTLFIKHFCKRKKKTGTWVCFLSVTYFAWFLRYNRRIFYKPREVPGVLPFPPCMKNIEQFLQFLPLLLKGRNTKTLNPYPTRGGGQPRTSTPKSKAVLTTTLAVTFFFTKPCRDKI